MPVDFNFILVVIAVPEKTGRDEGGSECSGTRNEGGGGEEGRGEVSHEKLKTRVKEWKRRLEDWKVGKENGVHQ